MLITGAVAKTLGHGEFSGDDSGVPRGRPQRSRGKNKKQIEWAQNLELGSSARL